MASYVVEATIGHNYLHIKHICMYVYIHVWLLPIITVQTLNNYFNNYFNYRIISREYMQ